MSHNCHQAAPPRLSVPGTTQRPANPLAGPLGTVPGAAERCPSFSRAGNCGHGDKNVSTRDGGRHPGSAPGGPSSLVTPVLLRPPLRCARVSVGLGAGPRDNMASSVWHTLRTRRGTFHRWPGGVTAGPDERTELSVSGPCPSVESAAKGGGRGWGHVHIFPGENTRISGMVRCNRVRGGSDPGAKGPAWPAGWLAPVRHLSEPAGQ